MVYKFMAQYIFEWTIKKITFNMLIILSVISFSLEISKTDILIMRKEVNMRLLQMYL